MAIPSERNTSVKVQGPGNRGQQDVGNNDYNNTLGLVKKGLEKYTGKIPSNINIQEVQKIALLGTAHIKGRVLSI